MEPQENWIFVATIKDKDAEIARLNETITWYQGRAGQRIGEAARAEMAGAPAGVPVDRNMVLEVAANYRLKDDEKIFYSRLGQSCDDLPFMTDSSIHSVWDIAMVFKASHKRPSHIFLDPFYTNRAHKSADPAPSEQARPTVKQLSAQLDDDKPWTRAEQDAFAVFLARFPDESSQGIMSLGDAWKAGRVFEAAAAPVAPLPELTGPSELEAENERLREALADKVSASTLLTELNLKGGALNMQFEGGACRLLAESFGQQFREMGGDNYLEIGFVCKDGLRLLVTLQRCDGKTPANLKAEAETKLAQVENELAGLRSVASPSPAPARQQEPSEATDISKELRRYAGDGDGYAAKMMRSAANEIERLHTAKSHLILQAQIWHGEAKSQRATVIGILARLGLPENDWEAKRLIVAHIAKLTGAPVPHVDGITSKESAEPAAPGVSTEDADLDSALYDAMAEQLSDLYSCGRVWSAWSYGTMTEDDFSIASEDEDIVANFVSAARSVLDKRSQGGAA